MGRNKVIVLAHPLREQLAEVVLNIPGFELAASSQSFVLANRTSWNKDEKKTKRSGPSLAARSITVLQNMFGLVNVKRFTNRDGDLTFANGGFLITNKPYITYVEKSTQLFGYSGRHYGKPVAKYLLKKFLRDPQLKKIFFRTQSALEGMLAIPSFDAETKQLIREKGMAVYPPLANPQTPSLARFKQPKEVSFVFVSSIFYEKGGLELIHAFQRVAEVHSNAVLHIITKKSKIQPEHMKRIQSVPQIKLHEATFTREELFSEFFNTAHGFVYPTYSDSFSAVINEAISAYLPIITSDFFAIPERVVDGENGFLFASPFPNYDKHKVIYEEHFKESSRFPAELSTYQAEGKLQYVEDFLFEKMSMLITNPKQLLAMAEAAKEMYDTKLNADTIRQTIAKAFHEALDEETN